MNPKFPSHRSPDAAQRNPGEFHYPGLRFTPSRLPLHHRFEIVARMQRSEIRGSFIIPDCVSLHPGYPSITDFS